MLTPFDEELFVGTKFAERYQIMSVVGRGSMGVVYKAKHELMGRLVAIKMLRGQLQLDERSVKRFEREARAASRLDHPNVIAVHDFGLTEHRQPYLVMDYASGVTLYEIQKQQGILDPVRAVHIFEQVCDALHHAHLQGVIHRDLKPSNIMIVQKDEDPDFVKVFDLGIAKIAWGEGESENEAITGTGEVCGSPVYLSPEQCKHEAIDHRTDIYSLGVMLYELLTGVPPLMGETVYDTIYLHVHEDAPRFSQVTDIGLPSRLEQICLKALSKNPDDRQQSMQELKWDLQASLLQSDPILNVLPPEALQMGRRRPAAGAPVDERESDKVKRSGQMPSIPPASRSGQMPNIPPAQRSGQGPAVRSGQGPAVRSGQGPAVRSGQRPSNSEQTSVIRSVQTQAVPHEEFAEEPRRKLGPVAMTALVSSIISIVATLTVLAIMNSGKSSTKITSPEPEGKSLMFRQPIKKDGSINLSTTPVRGNIYSAPSAVSKPVRVSQAREKLRPVEKPQHAEKVQKPVIAAVPPPAPKQPEVKSQPAQPEGGFNPFFSIFAPGKSSQPAPSPKKTSKPKGGMQMQAPVVDPGQAPQQAQQPPQQQPQQQPMQQPQQPQQQPPRMAMQPPAQQPVQPASGPSQDDQMLAVQLNNEAVAVLGTNPQGAIDKLNRAIKLNPAYVKARINLGNAYHNLANRQRGGGDTINAINSYRQSLNILTEAAGNGHPATQATKQDYESCLQSVGITGN